MKKIILGAIFLAFGTATSWADKKAPENTSGSSDVIVEGQSAKRAGDIDPADAIYSTNVFFNGKPAIIGCRKGIPITAKSVFINGKPKVLGCKKPQ
ncbi:MAG: hypothetical protein ACRBBN_00990 [Methyloligellaceae bacterium]